MQSCEAKRGLDRDLNRRKGSTRTLDGGEARRIGPVETEAKVVLGEQGGKSELFFEIG